MDSADKTFVIVLITVMVGAAVLLLGSIALREYHEREMADRGYVQHLMTGASDPVWVKP